jgi:hypothetical protein
VPAAIKDLVIDQGDSYKLVVRIRTKVYDALNDTYVPGPYKNLTGLFGKAQIRSTPAAATTLADFTVTIPDQTVTANLGQVILTLTPQQTTAIAASPNFPAPSGVWELELSDNVISTSATWRKTYLAGVVAIDAEVTR